MPIVASAVFTLVMIDILVAGAILVKGIPFDPTDVEISGPDLFRQLLPMKAHEASSLYRSLF